MKLNHCGYCDKIFDESLEKTNFTSLSEGSIIAVPQIVLGITNDKSNNLLRY